MKEILKKNWEYTLLQDSDNSYVLSVLCGSVGLYELKIKLEEAELSEYQRQGVEYIERLAKGIRRSPSSYKGRALKKEAEREVRSTRTNNTGAGNALY